MLAITYISFLMLAVQGALSTYAKPRQHSHEQDHVQNRRDNFNETVPQTLRGDPVGMPYVPIAATVPDESPTVISGASGAAPSTIQHPSTITPAPNAPPVVRYPSCMANVSSVSIYYWPQESSNTDCLATITAPTEKYIYPEPFGLNPVYPSVYALIESFTITATDGHEFIWDIFTASFDPSEMSTQDGDGTTKSFNFADFPCPPPAVNLNGRPYQPWFVPPPSVLDQMGKGVPGFPRDNCYLGNWFDPASAIFSQSSVNGPHIPARTVANPQRRAADIPAETGSPPVKPLLP